MFVLVLFTFLNCEIVYFYSRIFSYYRRIYIFNFDFICNIRVNVFN